MRASFPSTLEDSRKTVESFSGNDETQQCCRAIVVNGEAAGCIALFVKNDVYCKSAEIAYWLGEPFWGKGIMSRAIGQLCQIGFEQYDIVRISAEPYAHNIGSRKALEKAGFVLEGIMKKSVYKKGKFFDSCMYALVKQSLIMSKYEQHIQVRLFRGTFRSFICSFCLSFYFESLGYSFQLLKSTGKYFLEKAVCFAAGEDVGTQQVNQKCFIVFYLIGYISAVKDGRTFLLSHYGYISSNILCQLDTQTQNGLLEIQGLEKIFSKGF